ncbi:hypothetical protein [Desulfonema ishimotonii]|uniref:hypothetical protein n=1 Tax=Desulfonema ishimotonii TaxID=45657 RepID=UPI000F575FAA|nr:hypothetical protein [Desulfonema ishimotonii]
MLPLNPRRANRSSPLISGPYPAYLQAIQAQIYFIGEFHASTATIFKECDRSGRHPAEKQVTVFRVFQDHDSVKTV